MKQANVNFVHLCDAANLDSLGKLSVLGIFNRVFLETVPGVLSHMTLVLNASLLSPFVGKHKLQIKITDSKGEDVPLNPPVAIDFEIPNEKKNKVDVNLMFDINNFNFLVLGLHVFNIILDDIKIGQKELIIEKTEKKQ